MTASIEILDSEFGKVRVSPTPAPPAKTGKDGGRVSSRRESREIRQATPPLKDQDKALTSNGREAVDLSLGTLDPLLAEAFCSPSCPPLLLPQKDLPALIARVAQSLEEEDVKRLSRCEKCETHTKQPLPDKPLLLVLFPRPCRFAVASATYTAAYNSVRWKPLESEEEEAFKARMATGRRVRKGPSLLLDGDHHYEGGELRRSRVVGGGGHGPPRPLDTSKAQGAQAQRKRKAQQRDLQGFVDEDEYPGGGGGGGGGNNNKSRFGSRDDLTGLARSQRAGGGGSGLMRAPRAGGGGMGLPPHGMHPPGMGMAAGNLRGLPSLPPLQRMTAVRSGAVPPTPPAYRLGQAIQPPLGSGER